MNIIFITPLLYLLLVGTIFVLLSLWTKVASSTSVFRQGALKVKLNLLVT